MRSKIDVLQVQDGSVKNMMLELFALLRDRKCQVQDSEISCDYIAKIVVFSFEFFCLSKSHLGNAYQFRIPDPIDNARQDTRKLWPLHRRYALLGELQLESRLSILDRRRTSFESTNTRKLKTNFRSPMSSVQACEHLCCRID